MDLYPDPCSLKLNGRVSQTNVHPILQGCHVNLLLMQAKDLHFLRTKLDPMDGLPNGQSHDTLERRGNVHWIV